MLVPGATFSPRRQLPKGSGGSDFTTSFPATENPISQGSIWVTGGADGLDWQDVQTTANTEAWGDYHSAVNVYTDDLAHLKTSFRTFNANHFAQGVVYKTVGYAPTVGAHEIELHLRHSITAHTARGYEVLWGVTGYVSVVLWNGAYGDFQALYDPGVGSIPVPTDGDTFRAEISGNIIKIFRNGSQVGPNIDITANDTLGNAPKNVWNTGQPGMGFWPDPGTDVVNNSLGWKSYRAGDL